ncbi:Cu-Zn family superoxide dismutase [Saccharothrix carnea]|uniref:Cu-Zn family superoxide dismutase n=1 Tax=Saccharothrix carnea TaxID=1280637 RepID=A0A2P8HZM3_SACCR|nr:superoxide dismutase [Saccharothrix carnea]PSL51651.1 Cu-Zn family superoxide dismutase [Saccharothrix carnea]
MRVVIVVAVLCAAVACGEDLGPGDAQSSADEVSTREIGVLAPPEAADSAFTYDQEAAPAGAELQLEVLEGDGATTVRLSAELLQPDRGYAVHAHTDPCGRNGTDAGPHYQHEVDPAATPERPSVDPAYANPQNEIWLELTTDGQGNGLAETTVPFTFDDRVPASIVLHEQPTTATGHGRAGSAGARLACFTAPFR